MNNYQILEFHTLINKLAQYSHSTITIDTLNHLHILSKYQLDKEFKKIQEAMSIDTSIGHIPLDDMMDLEDILKVSKIDGILSCADFFHISSQLHTVFSIKEYLQDYEGDIIYLKDLFDGLTYIKPLVQSIDNTIEGESIKDHASQELYHIRKQMKHLQSSMRHSIEQSIKDHHDYLSIDNISMRNDHMVLAVKKDYRNQVKGLVHASSSTGQTIYIEPEDVVIKNNEYSNLLIQEQQEIRRILKELTKLVKHYALELQFNQDILLQLDVIFVKARFGNEYDCCIPEIDNRLYLKQARHPLLDQKTVISNDFKLDKHMFMITGSNTGGKTVALKTIGLLSLMGLCGIPVCAIEAHIPLFDDIYVDLGDHQSIEESLSTYSSHMKNIISILEHVSSQSLVIIDEIGSGTDPQEGTFLAKAILDVLLDKGCMTCISTHYGELKNYGLLHDDILIGAMGFDFDNLKPTYHLQLDVAGDSYAFEIAENLGLDKQIINKALLYKNNSLSEADKLLESLNEKEKELESKSIQINNTLQHSKQLEEEYKQKLSKINQTRERIIEEAHLASNKIIEETKQTVSSKMKELSNQTKSHVYTQTNQQLDKLKWEKEEKKQDHIFKQGDYVKIDKMNREGTVIEIKKNHQLVVSIDGLPITLKDTEITYIHDEIKTKKKKVRTHQKIQKTGSYEINIIGMRYTEAMNTLEKFLDDALLLGYPSVRIVHGLGKGILKKGVRDVLNKKSFIKSYTDGGPNEGGLGVTLAQLE